MKYGVLFLSILFASLVFGNDNPYENLNSIEENQIKGESFLEVYNDQNDIEDSFDFFAYEETEAVSEEDPDLDPFPGPLPINDYLPILVVVAIGLGFYYRNDLKQITKSK